MKKLVISFIALLFAQNVFAVNAYDMLISQRNSTNTGYVSWNPVSPTSTEGIFYYDLPSHSFVWLVPGNFTRSGGTLYAPQADWNAVSGNNVIANKPFIPTKTSDLTNDAGFLDSSTGVTPSAMSTALSNYSTTSVMTGALSAKMDNPGGTPLQYMRGDGTLATSLSVFDAAGAAATAQAYAVQRANQTGTQSADTLTDGTTNKAFLATERTKLSSIATGATANDTDANLKNRANHTGTQLASTISDFNAAADARVVAGIAGKENTITAGTASQYFRGDKSWQTLDKTAVGLSAADNTSDATKNSATATLTNKTISGTSNTFSNIPYSALTGIPTVQAIQRIRVQTNSTGDYTWTYPVAYGSGVIPIISAVSESASSTVPQGVQIVGVPTNTSATFKVINLPSTSVLSIVVLGAPTAAQAYIHLTAVAP